MYMSHFICIHSSVGGHLSCFHLLTIVDNVAPNMGVQIFVQVPAFASFRLDLEVGLLCHMVILSIIL